VGTDHSINNLSMFVSIETDGLFQFPNLAALEARRPSSFARLVPLQTLEPRMRQWVYDGGAYVQGEYRVRPNLNLTGGLRADMSAFLTAANPNPAVEQAFGRRTNVKPTDIAIQPRAQLTWTPGEAGTNLLRVGSGFFTAQPHYMVQINHMLNDGTQLRCRRPTSCRTASRSPTCRGFRREARSVRRTSTCSATSSRCRAPGKATLPTSAASSTAT
jgi:hypothetical protein